jgi:hypothetical protein
LKPQKALTYADYNDGCQEKTIQLIHEDETVDWTQIGGWCCQVLEDDQPIFDSKDQSQKEINTHEKFPTNWKVDWKW